MKPIVGLVAQGAMGSGVGARLVSRGLTVWTVLEGRSAKSAERAAAAGMVPAPKADMAKVDIFLSIVPPAEAIATAEWLTPVLKAASRKPVYADLNAVSPATAKKVAAVIAATGCPFADGGIIGGPPKAEGEGPAIYVSGEGAAKLGELAQYGLDMRVMDAPAGAASAVKLSYAGITKGFTAMSSMMVLAATRNGASEHLAKELAAKSSRLLAQIVGSTPAMFDKAYRFGGEMRELNEYLADDEAAAEVYNAYAKFYDRIAEDYSGETKEVGALKAFIEKAKK